MKDLEKMSKEELYIYLEDMTFRNILGMRQSELLRIMDGERAVHVIPQSNQRRILRRDGILKEMYLHGGKTLIVTQRAQLLLEEMV